jgi:hypothetical protein
MNVKRNWNWNLSITAEPLKILHSTNEGMTKFDHFYFSALGAFTRAQHKTKTPKKTQKLFFIFH